MRSLPCLMRSTPRTSPSCAANRIDGKIASVIGGTQGLGAAIVCLFVRAGAAGVAIVGRDQTKGGTLAAKITADSGVAVQMIAADLREMVDVMRAAAPAEGDAAAWGHAYPCRQGLVQRPGNLRLPRGGHHRDRAAIGYVRYPIEGTFREG